MRGQWDGLFWPGLFDGCLNVNRAVVMDSSLGRVGFKWGFVLLCCY